MVQGRMAAPWMLVRPLPVFDVNPPLIPFNAISLDPVSTLTSPSVFVGRILS